jgi:hypothetical protein
MTGAFGTIPQSNALAEASSDSELMSISPMDQEKFIAALPRIVANMREHRARLAAAEASGKGVKAAKIPSESASRPKPLKGAPIETDISLDF